MNRSLNSPARWTIIRAAGLAIVAAAVVLPAANAEATCMVSGNIRYCTPSSSTNPLTISVGIDNTGGQFIAYQDAVTGLCTWDMIGSSTAFYNQTRVTGTNHSDTMQTVRYNGTMICGHSLNPPIPGGYDLWFYSGGGSDYMASYLTSGSQLVNLSCYGQAEGCYFELWGPGSISGSESNDQVHKEGVGNWGFSTYGGSDMIWNDGSGTVVPSNCGSDTDYYYGTWDSYTFDCEVR